jgi:hypothetical protein
LAILAEKNNEMTKKLQIAESKITKLSISNDEKLPPTLTTNLAQTEKQQPKAALKHPQAVTQMAGMIQAKEIVRLKDENVTYANENEMLRKEVLDLKNDNTRLFVGTATFIKDSDKYLDKKPIVDKAQERIKAENVGWKKKQEIYLEEINSLKKQLEKVDTKILEHKNKVLRIEITKCQGAILRLKLLVREKALSEQTNEEALSDNGLDIFQEQNSQYIGYRYKEQLVSILENEYHSDEEKIKSLSEYLLKK